MVLIFYFLQCYLLQLQFCLTLLYSYPLESTKLVHVISQQHRRRVLQRLLIGLIKDMD